MLHEWIVKSIFIYKLVMYEPFYEVSNAWCQRTITCGPRCNCFLTDILPCFHSTRWTAFIRCVLPSGTGCGKTSGRSSRHASGFRAWSSSTAPPSVPSLSSTYPTRRAPSVDRRHIRCVRLHYLRPLWRLWFQHPIPFQFSCFKNII